MEFLRKVAASSSPDVHGDGPSTQATRLTQHRSAGLLIANGCDLECLENDSTSDRSGHVKIVFKSTSRLQSVATSEDGRAAVVDDAGRVAVSVDGRTFDQLSRTRMTMDSGWHGLAFNGITHELAVASMWSKITYFPSSDSMFRHEMPVTSIASSCRQPNVFYVSEWADLTIWDKRASRGGFVERLSGNQIGGGGCAPIWSACTYDNYICIGGESRTVSIYDERKLRLVETWRTPLKDDIVSLAFSGSAEHHIIALGMDHEICSWRFLNNGKSGASDVEIDESDKDEDERRTNLGRLHHNHRVFRAKARWTGICASGDDQITCRDAEGTIYYFQCP